MPPSRKRRAVSHNLSIPEALLSLIPEFQPVDEPEDYEEEPTTISETQTQRTGRIQASPTYEDNDEVDGGHDSSSTGIEQLAKRLVRYALACEYSRVPIKRPDVSSKILGSQSRQFQVVFDRAQVHLGEVFGMEMVELPNREKVTIRQKRGT